MMLGIRSRNGTLTDPSPYQTKDPRSILIGTSNPENLRAEVQSFLLMASQWASVYFFFVSPSPEL